jgi:hypothetical protein
MTPPPNADDVCGGCFLYERRGVCPAARDAYGLQNSAAAERRAEQFRQDIAQEAQAVVTLAELMRRDAERQRTPRSLPMPSPLGLPKPNAERVPTNSRKEAVRVPVSRSTR